MTAPATLDLTPTWAGLLPALFAMLESGTGEGPGIARQELSRLAAWADSHNAQAKAGAADLARREEEAAEERNRFGLESVALGRERAALDLARAGRDFMTQGAFMRAACYWEAAARIAPAGMEAARDFRVSADLAEREAAALLDSTFATIRKEERAIASDVLEALAPAPAMQAAIAAALDAAKPPHKGVQSFAAIRAALAPFAPADLAPAPASPSSN